MVDKKVERKESTLLVVMKVESRAVQLDGHLAAPSAIVSAAMWVATWVAMWVQKLELQLVYGEK